MIFLHNHLGLSLENLPIGGLIYHLNGIVENKMGVSSYSYPW